MDGFWEGFGRVCARFREAEILDFRTFFVIFSMQNLECKLERLKTKKEGCNFFFPAILAVCAALGGRIIGWGEGKFGQSFKPGLKMAFKARLFRLRKAFEARLGPCTLYLARSASLREAADVLRTYRRAARGEPNANVNAMLGSLQQLAHRLRKW